METFSREKNYYKDSLIVKHHKIKYSSKMPLWVIVELMSFSNMSKLYRISERLCGFKENRIEWKSMTGNIP